MSNKNNQFQIDRKDAKNCFVESLSDFFAYGKVHFNFITYDTSKPEGERITNYVNIYIEVDKFLEFCRKLSSGELRYVIQQKRSTGDSKPIDEWLGGISAKKLAESGNSRSDGKSLSRVAKLLCGNKSEFLFIADSGAGEQNRQGLIVPRFGVHPENHVAVSLSWDSLAELFLLTKEHYQAWLSSWYLVRMMASQKMQSAGKMVQDHAVQQIAAGSQPALQQGAAAYQQYSGVGQTNDQKYNYQQIPDQQNSYQQGNYQQTPGSGQTGNPEYNYQQIPNQQNGYQQNVQYQYQSGGEQNNQYQTEQQYAHPYGQQMQGYNQENLHTQYQQQSA